MLKRDYQAPEFRVQDTRTIDAQNVAQSDNRPSVGPSFGDETWRDRMLAELSSKGANTLNKMADVAFGNLYLEGQAKAGQIESEAEIEGNPLTRDWQVAGYRDTMGKLALADTEAQFQVDIKDLREQPPEKLQEYLSQRRSKLMPGIAGMSAEARAAAAGQLLLQDRAAIKTHTAEHNKFIVEQKSQAIHTQWGTTMRVLGSAQDRLRMQDMTPDAFNAQLDSAAGVIVGTVWEDRSLNDPLRKQLTFEMVQSMLVNDSVELYDYLAQNEMPDGKGGKSTLLARLDEKQQQQLGNEYRASMKRTSDARNQLQMAQVANIEAQIDAGMYRGSYEDLNDVLMPMVARGVITGEKRAGILKAYNKEQYDGDQNAALAEFGYRGDMHGAFLMGKTPKDVADAIDAGLVKRNAPPEVRLDTYLTAGKNGTQGMFEKAGDMLQSTLMQIRSGDGKVLEQHRKTFTKINSTLAEARKTNPHADIQLLSGMTEADRMFVTRIMAEVENNNASLDQAVARATDVEGKEAKLTPSQRAGASQAIAAAVQEHIAGIEPHNFLEYSWQYAKSMIPGSIGEGARAALATNIESNVGFRDGWFSDSPVTQQYVDVVREDTQQEAARLLKTASSTTDPAALARAAAAGTAARTISTRHGPVVIPHGVEQSALFGVAQGNLSRVGPALDSMFKETKENSRYVIKYMGGKLHYQEYDNKGVPIGTGDVINPKDVRKRVDEMVTAEGAKADERYGSGKRVKVGAVELRYNGASPHGNVPHDWMLEFRDSLVKNEGIKDTPYEDQTGKKDKAGNTIKTLGVGVTSTSPHYPEVGPDGKASPDAIRKSFLGASADAAAAGAKLAADAGVHNKAGFALMSELAYQSGVNFMGQENKTGARYREFVDTLRTGDVAAAQEAFKRTAAWYWSADRKKPDAVTARQKHYLNLIEKSIKGA